MTDHENEVNENSKVTIKRGKHNKENPYVMISKKMLKDQDLSIKAKGVLCYLLSLPDDWVMHPRHVASTLGISKNVMYSMLKELIIAGYAVKQEIRDEKSRFSSINYLFYEEKLEYKEFKEKSTVSQNPDTEIPCRGKRDPDFGTLQNTYLTENINEPYITSPTPHGDSPIGEKEGQEDIPDKIPKRTKLLNDFSPQVRELAAKMMTAIQVAVPVFRPSHNVIPFVKHVHYLVDNDKYDPDLIMQVLKYALDDDIERDNFKGWQSVMLSKNPAETLRKHFTKIYSQMKSRPKQKDRKFAPSSDQERARKAMEEMRKTAL